MPVFIITCLVAVIVSFLCSLAEAVLLSLNPIRLETLKRQGKSYASVWLNMRQNMGRPIAAILILNTIAHTGGATIAGGAFHDIYGDEWVWLFSVLFTVVILLGTEKHPKVQGVSYS
jgi:Mg2+/Co2+ transporter CorB